MMVKMVEGMKLVEVMEAGEVEEKQPPLPQVASMPRPPYSGATPCFAGYWATLNFFQSPYFFGFTDGNEQSAQKRPLHVFFIFGKTQLRR